VGAAAAVAVICAAATLAFWPSSPVPSVGPGSPRLSGFLSGGLVVITLPDGSIVISGGEARTDRPPDGYGVVLAEGELR
jgi:hypothetical protein